MSDVTVHPAGPLRGRLRIPGDKSISHRALLLGAIARGPTRIEGFLDSEDTRATMAALEAMGIQVTRPEREVVLVHGAGLYGLRAPAGRLDLGNSGTSVRLLAGLLCGQSFDSELVGDASLMRRPMRRIIDPLRQMGADIRCTQAGTLPIHIRGGAALKGIHYEMPVASAQLKSAILLAGLYASGKTRVVEPAVTRDHSERMLSRFGSRLEQQGAAICLHAGDLQGQDLRVPGDISSAAFFLAAAAIVPGSDLRLEGVGMNPTRHAVIEILRTMGADIAVKSLPAQAGEPLADLRVRHSALRGIEIPARLVPIAIDELPVLMVAAAFAGGTTRLRGAAELRVKESDRIHAVCSGLDRLGIEALECEDGLCVTGGQVGGATVDSFGDHRIAMAFLVAGLAASAAVTVRNCASIDTSFPGFVDCIGRLGGQVSGGAARHA